MTATVFWSTIALVLLSVWSGWRFWYFHRNPPRRTPRTDGVLSPADGRVIYCESADASDVEGRLAGATDYSERVCSAVGLMGGWNVTAIYLSIFDVHFVRAPIEGEISIFHLSPRPKNISMEWPMVAAILKRPLPLGRRSYRDKNEIVAARIRSHASDVVVVMMADWWVRQISLYAQNGGRVRAGDVIAKIHMGSQVDLWLPRLCVQPLASIGDRVRAGESVIGSYKAREGPAGA